MYCGQEICLRLVDVNNTQFKGREGCFCSNFYVEFEYFCI